MHARHRLSLDRYAARCLNSVLVLTRIAVLGARPSTMLGTALSTVEGRSAPKDTGNQPRALWGCQGWGRGPRLAWGFAGTALLWAAVVAGTTRPVAAQEGSSRKIWDGVYTEAQAARGKPAYETSCGRCHNNELVGSERAPALKGDGFFSHWENDTLDKLFTKIRDTMPAGGIESVTDAGKLDILAFVLAANGAPAGREELSLEQPALEAITIVRQSGAPEGVSNFNLVQLVGCLTPADKGWKLTSATEPVVTKDESSTAAALAKAGEQPLGSLDVELVSVISGYQADRRAGQKVEARGLIFRSNTERVLNLTSLQPVGANCP